MLQKNDAPSSLFSIKSPTGEEIEIPVSVNTAYDPYSELQTTDHIHDYYHNYGYVILRKLIPSDLCDRARQSFDREVKPYKGYLYRQPSSGSAEKHRMTEYGYLLNSILNIQNLDEKKFLHFKKASLDIITHKKLYDAVFNLLGEAGTIVQAMYFEGNPETWAHQDTYYLDSTRLGQMTAAWIALEDIQPGAGRFFIYPRSHQIDMVKNGGDFDIAFNHKRYKDLVMDVIKKHRLECRAPAMQKGDVLFWSSRTIHGSLETSQPQFSRSSITAHFIPESSGLLQFQTREQKIYLRQVGLSKVNFSKDQSFLKNRVLLKIESSFPKTFQLLKRFVIKLVTQ